MTNSVTQASVVGYLGSGGKLSHQQRFKDFAPSAQDTNPPLKLLQLYGERVWASSWDLINDWGILPEKIFISSATWTLWHNHDSRTITLSPNTYNKCVYMAPFRLTIGCKFGKIWKSCWNLVSGCCRVTFSVFFSILPFSTSTGLQAPDSVVRPCTINHKHLIVSKE